MSLFRFASQIRTYTYMHMHTRPDTHSCAHTYSEDYKSTNIHTCASMHLHLHLHMCIYTYTVTHLRTHADTHTQAQEDVHTHVYKHSCHVPVGVPAYIHTYLPLRRQSTCTLLIHVCLCVWWKSCKEGRSICKSVPSTTPQDPKPTS